MYTTCIDIIQILPAKHEWKGGPEGLKQGINCPHASSFPIYPHAEANPTTATVAVAAVQFDISPSASAYFKVNPLSFSLSPSPHRQPAAISPDRTNQPCLSIQRMQFRIQYVCNFSGMEANLILDGKHTHVPNMKGPTRPQLLSAPLLLFRAVAWLLP